KLGEVADKPVATRPPASTTRSPGVAVEPPRAAPDYERHELALRLHEIWPYLNEQTLYATHLGLQGKVSRLAETGDEKFLKLERVVDDVKKRAEGGWLRARGVYQFFRANSDGNDVLIYDGGMKEIARFAFPRQVSGDQL